MRVVFGFYSHIDLLTSENVAYQIISFSSPDKILPFRKTYFLNQDKCTDFGNTWPFKHHTVLIPKIILHEEK